LLLAPREKSLLYHLVSDHVDAVPLRVLEIVAKILEDLS